MGQYFIPILGMLLGNAISGVSVGLSALLEELTTGAHYLSYLPCLCVPGRAAWPSGCALEQSFTDREAVKITRVFT